MSDTSIAEALFKEVRYFAVGEIGEKIREELLKGKAKSESYLSALATHAIVSDPTHYEAEAARDVWQIPCVTPTWVEMSSLCKSQLPTEAFSSLPGHLFSNKIICFSQLSKNDKATLWSYVTYHGGNCQSYLNNKCTHLIALLPVGDKYDKAVTHGNINIVAPDWITDSVKLNKLQAEEKYHPRLNISPDHAGENLIAATRSDSTNDIEKLKISDTNTSVHKPNVKHTGAQQAEAQSMDIAAMLSETEKQLLNSSTAGPSPAVVYTTNIAHTQASTSDKQVGNLNSSGIPFSTTNQTLAQPIRYGVTQQQAVNSSTATNIRFSMSNAPMRSPYSMMSSTGHQFPMMSSSQQSYPMMSSNQQPMGIMSPGQQQRGMMSSGSPYIVMSPPPRSNIGSPRRNTNQSSGKKKKGGGNRPPHSTVRQVHPMSQQFQSNSQVMFSPQQQQMMMTPRMGGATEQSAMLSGMPDSGMKPVAMTGPRFGIQGRFPSRAMAPQQNENYQHIQQQQLMQMQQQQQMQRMNMMRQTPPNIASQTQVESMQQKWPRSKLESGFPLDNQPQQIYQPNTQQSPNTSNETIRQPMQSPGQPPPGQAMAVSATQNMTSPHQHYNPMMINRFAGQVNPQQMMIQQISQQQRPQGSSRFPTSTSLEAAGMSGISPIALQQGLLNSQMQIDNPPLIHPSLQGTLFPKVPASTQSSGTTSTQKKRPKSRKKVEGGDEEGKGKSRQRNVKTKKTAPITSPITPNNMMGANMVPMQASPNMSHVQFTPQGMLTSPIRSMVGHMLPATQHHFANLHQNQTVQSPSAQLQFPTSITQHMSPSAMMTRPHQQQHGALQSQENVVQVTKTESGKEVLAARKFVDPLTYLIKEIETQYTTRDISDTVPIHLFLLGCIFHICEYEEVVSDASVIRLWKKMIEKFGGIVEDSYTPSCTHVVCVSCMTPISRQAISEGKRCVTVYWLNDVLQLRCLRVPWLVLHLPTNFSHKNKPATNHLLSYTGFHAKERERIKMTAFVCGAKFTGFLSRSNTALLCKSSTGLKYNKAQSWMIPCVTLEWLRDLIHGDDVATSNIQQDKYQKYDDGTINGFLLDVEKCRHILEPWKVAISITQACLMKSKVKRKSDVSNSITPVTKRPRSNDNYQVLPRICFTGIPPIFVQELKKKLESLNCRFESTFALCTHLVAQNVSRTVKFLSCISSCQYVVTPDWIEESFKNNWLLDEEGYALIDKNMEEKFKFSLQESIKRANKTPLFKDCLFCITSKVVPDNKILKQIIECAGGQVLNKMPNLHVLKHMKSKSAPSNRVFIISCHDDIDIYNPLKKEGIVVHNAEVVLTGVLTQKINMELNQL